MTILSARIMMALLIALTAGCSKSDDAPAQARTDVIEPLEPESQTFFSYIKDRLAQTLEVFAPNDDFLQAEPIAEDLLREEISPEQLKRYDEERLQERAKQMQKNAAATGGKPKHNQSNPSKSIRELGLRFGLSEERIAELEAMAAAKAQKTAADGPSAPATHQTPPHPTPPFSTQPSGPTAPRNEEKTKNASVGPASAHSMELLEILNRRQERLHDASKKPPVP
ncbi:MAG: hypothetical protein HQL73_07710 [Magnetococcales bacterium]|nr:hypothetical protein [Magnetococcales bacterium]